MPRAREHFKKLRRRLKLTHVQVAAQQGQVIRQRCPLWQVLQAHCECLAGRLALHVSDLQAAAIFK